ncbi:hypothetical protein [Campylobacter majalis]|uniref:hypothetical protein n=1 Tax=Campylobacter majalis TaxID=2790656 RepID=UPI001E3B9298|nr:hypothetical protein [Campylobacter majalis]
MATNLAGYAVASIAATTALSFLPFIGSPAASVIADGIAYAITFASGVICMKTLETLFKTKKSFNGISKRIKKATKKDDKTS